MIQLNALEYLTRPNRKISGNVVGNKEVEFDPGEGLISKESFRIDQRTPGSAHLVA